ncbi:MAG: hypothetical protein ABIJ97_01335, partial [Bacteroidota bacterium]
TEKSVLDLLLLHDLCEKSFPIATFVLKLTNKGRIAATKGIEKYLQEIDEYNKLDIESKKAAIINLKLSKKDSVKLNVAIFVAIVMPLSIFIIERCVNNNVINTNDKTNNHQNYSDDKFKLEFPVKSDSINKGSLVIKIVSDSLDSISKTRKDTFNINKGGKGKK